jgi:hypothetical protein
VRAAVSEDWRALKYASDELKNDRSIVLSAANQNGRALEYASDEMKMIVRLSWLQSLNMAFYLSLFLRN